MLSPCPCAFANHNLEDCPNKHLVKRESENRQAISATVIERPLDLDAPQEPGQQERDTIYDTGIFGRANDERPINARRTFSFAPQQSLPDFCKSLVKDSSMDGSQLPHLIKLIFSDIKISVEPLPERIDEAADILQHYELGSFHSSVWQILEPLEFGWRVYPRENATHVPHNLLGRLRVVRFVQRLSSNPKKMKRRIVERANREK